MIKSSLKWLNMHTPHKTVHYTHVMRVHVGYISGNIYSIHNLICFNIKKHAVLIWLIQQQCKDFNYVIIMS